VLLDRDGLKKVIKDNGIRSTEDLQELMREMTKEVIEVLYEGELEEHLGYPKHGRSEEGKGNSRNGYSQKKVQSKSGEVELSVPRDRVGTYEPMVVKKRQRDITGIEDKVISMYGKGMSTRDISAHIEDIYGHALSAETISRITDLVLGRAKEWQSRPLEPIYAIVFMDAMVMKMRVEGAVRKASMYMALGVDLAGNKSCLGMYVSESESAKYWLSVMNDLKNRGLEDVLIFAVDNLNGMSEAIEAVYPKSEIQKCIVHQVRNALKYVPWKERKQVANDLKRVYKAATEEEGLHQLAEFDKEWSSKYPHIVTSWERNWAELATFYQYPQEIRRLIYTTNPIEGLNRAIRKVTKTRSVFPNEDSLLKLTYLAIADHEKHSAKIRNWGTIFSQLNIRFAERLEAYI
jgi:putative transposase